MKKIVFLGAKEIAVKCLGWLMNQSKDSDFILTAIGTKNTDPDNPIIRISEENRISLITHQDEIPECDYIISVQYHEILTSSNIKKAKEAAINLHLAPIPEYRGCNQFSFAIFNEEEEFGVTIHKIDAQIDHGDIISEKRFPISKNIWVEELWKQSNDIAFELFKETLPGVLKNTYSCTNWKSLKRNERIYYRKDINHLKIIDLEKDTTHTIDKKIRACSMPGFPPPYCMVNNIKISMTPYE